LLLGTTYSGASYCILTPGKKPQIEDVKSYPGQSTSGSKVPSVILYDSNGQARLFGAEASEGSAAAARLLDQDGAVARWWKLHLKPSHLQLVIDPEDDDMPLLDPLPFGIHAEAIAAEFLAYMVSCVGVSNGHWSRPKSTSSHICLSTSSSTSSPDTLMAWKFYSSLQNRPVTSSVSPKADVCLHGYGPHCLFVQLCPMAGSFHSSKCSAMPVLKLASSLKIEPTR
jgi:hypothetical protein